MGLAKYAEDNLEIMLERIWNMSNERFPRYTVNENTKQLACEKRLSSIKERSHINA